MKKTIFAILITAILVTLFCGCGKSTQYEWPNTELAQLLPTPNFKIAYLYDTSDSISARFESVSDEAYQKYVSECKEKGFNIEADESSGDYNAFNETGYHLQLHLYSDKDLTIDLDAPEDMADFTWPDSLAGKMVPQPKSTFGTIKWEHEDSFVIYVGHMTKEDFSEYARTCKDAGFSVNYRSGETYFYADNPDGYSLSLKYEGFSTIFIRLDPPEEVETEATEEPGTSPEDTDTPDTAAESTAEAPETAPTPSDETPSEETKAPETNDALFYSTNDRETAKNGNSGLFSYKNIGGSYDVFWIIDFDEGYVYYFTDGNGEETCMRVKIISGDLNAGVLVTYHDGADAWDESLCFRWKNQPDHLIWQDSDQNSYDFYPTDLNDALTIRETKRIIDYSEIETTRAMPEDTAQHVTYIVNINPQSMRFHDPDCASVKDMKESNKWEFTGTRDELIAMGYRPCGKCNP